MNGHQATKLPENYAQLISALYICSRIGSNEEGLKNNLLLVYTVRRSCEWVTLYTRCVHSRRDDHRKYTFFVLWDR